MAEWDKFTHIDAKAVIDGITSGKSITVDDIAKFSAIEAKSNALEELKKDNPESPDAEGDSLPDVDAEAKELADYEKAVFDDLGL